MHAFISKNVIKVCVMLLHKPLSLRNYFVMVKSDQFDPKDGQKGLFNRLTQDEVKSGRFSH